MALELETDLELGEIALILVAVIVIGYALKKGVSALGDAAKAGWDAVKTGASELGKSVSSAASEVAQPTITFSDCTPIGICGQTAGDLRAAGFSDAQIAALQAQVYNSF